MVFIKNYIISWNNDNLMKVDSKLLWSTHIDFYRDFPKISQPTYFVVKVAYMILKKVNEK